MPFLGHREVPRRRHDLPPRVLVLLRPFFRYSDWRDAWILRLIGERYGPVVREAPNYSPHRRAARPPASWNIDRARVALITGGAIVVGAGVGFLIARSAAGGSSTPPRPRLVSAGPLEVSLPAGWRRTTAPESGVTDEVAAASGGRLIVAGRAATSDPSLLPASILAALRSRPAAQLVTLRGATFYRYLNLALRGTAASESVYAVPTSAGTLLILCRARRPDAGFARTCQQVAESIRLNSGSVAPGLLPKYASTLSAVIGRLDAARSGWGSQLSTARTASLRARAARRLAAAHARAAAAVAALSAGPASSANASLAAALRMEAQAYRSLGRAAAKDRGHAYRTAAAAVTRADTALSSALAQLGGLGYPVS